MRVLRGESFEVVARETGGTPVAGLSEWRDAFLSAGEAALAKTAEAAAGHLPRQCLIMMWRGTV